MGMVLCACAAAPLVNHTTSFTTTTIPSFCASPVTTPWWMTKTTACLLVGLQRSTLDTRLSALVTLLCPPHHLCPPPPHRYLRPPQPPPQPPPQRYRPPRHRLVVWRRRLH